MVGPFKKIDEESKKAEFAMHMDGVPHGNIYEKIQKESEKHRLKHGL